MLIEPFKLNLKIFHKLSNCVCVFVGEDQAEASSSENMNEVCFVVVE